jgi:DNA polymerase III delta prime subunit
MDLPAHHAVLIEGNIEASIEVAKKVLSKIYKHIDANPDVMIFSYESLGIGEARDLVANSVFAPLQEDQRAIIVSFESITREAQNALLKLFEDPNPSVRFIIIAENADALLPTLRSRLFIIKSEFKKSEFDANKFFSLSLGDKVKESERLQKNYKESGSKKEIRSFMRAIHEKLLEEVKSGEGNADKHAEALRASAKSILYLDDKSSSVKILLDSLILAL